MNGDGFTTGDGSSDGIPVPSPPLPTKGYTKGIDAKPISGVACPRKDGGGSDLLGEELGKLISFTQMTTAEADDVLAGFIENDDGGILGFIG